MQEDVGFRHLFIDPSTLHVGMIDFQEADMLDNYLKQYDGKTKRGTRDQLPAVHRVLGSPSSDNSDDVRSKIDRLVQMMHIYQLLQVISNVCMSSSVYLVPGKAANLYLNNAMKIYLNTNKKDYWKRFNVEKPKMQHALKVCDKLFYNNNNSTTSRRAHVAAPLEGGGGGLLDDP